MREERRERVNERERGERRYGYNYYKYYVELHAQEQLLSTRKHWKLRHGNNQMISNLVMI